MRGWLYYRLSRDEDEELNSLTNQRSIIAGYAEKNGFTIAGESFDDNVSGMHFDRDGIEKICEAVEQNQIDAVIVKTFRASAATAHRLRYSSTTSKSMTCV